MRIWDAFLYNGELEALHARLALPGIHRRVLVEALMTHSGQPKAQLFYNWNLPGVTVVVPDLSMHTTSWARENAQRDAIMEGLAGASDADVIMLSDADETPTRDGIDRAVQALGEHRAVVLCQVMYNYHRGWCDPRGWRGTVVTTYGHLATTSPQALRDQRETLHRIPNAGEHLSWFGGTGEITRKLAAFAHTEYGDLAQHPDTVRDRVAAGQDLFGRWALRRTE